MNDQDALFVAAVKRLITAACLGLVLGCPGYVSSEPTAEAPISQKISVDLTKLPRQTFAGLRQQDAPQPVWTLEHYHPLGQPVISPDGRWLVVTRTGEWFKHGEWLVVVDLVNRVATDYKVPAPGLVGAAVFSHDGGELLGIVNTPEGHGFARWSFPTMAVTVTPLGAGVAFAAALTHRQDRAVVLREDGVAGVFDLARGTKQYEVTFQQGKVSFYSTAIAISPDDAVVASGVIQPGNEWVQWRLADGVRLPSPEVHERLAWGRPVDYTADGSALLVAAHHEMMMLGSKTGERLATYPGNGLNTLHNQPGVGLAGASIGQGETFGIIDTRTGQLRMWARHMARPPAPLGYADWAAISPDGKMAYSADYFSLKAWDLAGELERKAEWLFAGHPTRVLFNSPEGDHLLAVGETVDRWDLATRRLLSSQPSEWLHGQRAGDWRSGGKTQAVYAVGDRVRAIIMDEEGAQVYDLQDGKALLRIGVPRSQAGEVATDLAPVAGSPTGELQPTAAVFPQSKQSPGMAVSPDGTRLLVTTTRGFQAGVTLWDLETGRRLAVLGDHSTIPRLARFSTDGRTVVIVTANGGLSATHFSPSGLPITEAVAPAVSRTDQVTADVNDVLMPAPDRLYVGTGRGILSSWVRSDGKWHRRFESRITSANTSFQFPAAIARLAASPSGSTLAAILYDPPNDGGVLVLNAENGSVEARLDDNVLDLCFLGERMLATSSIRIWKLDGFSAPAKR